MFVLSQTWFLIVAGVTLVHWLVPASARGWWIAAATAAFLGWQSPMSLALLTGLTAVLYGLAGRQNHISGKRVIAIIILAGATLAIFKAQAALGGHRIDSSDFSAAVIPLGLSYYALRCIHYAVEKYKGAIPAHDFKTMAEYLFFLPTLIAGPIHRFPEFHKDLSRKRWDAVMFMEGLERIIYGLFKISFIANMLLNFEVKTWDADHPQLAAYLAMIQMGLNLYFQFSGYSDMAIGFGLLLGFRIMENFNFPLFRKNISEFWQCWHISLTSWCRDYIYMGIFASTRQRWLATLSAIVVLGLWHEFSLRYLLWGFYHGAGIMIWQEFQTLKTRLPLMKNSLLQKAATPFSIFLTFHFVMLGFVIVRHDTLDAVWDHWMKIIGVGS